MFGIVYRYEDENGTGPFEGTWLGDEMEAALAAAGQKNHPSVALWRGLIWWPDVPDMERLRFEAPRYGVASLRDLSRWFPRPARKVLADSGFRAIAYDLPPGAIFEVPGSSVAEVIFDRRRATEIPWAVARQKEALRRQAATAPPAVLDFDRLFGLGH